MTDAAEPHQPNFEPRSVTGRIDLVCDRFEAALREGQSPSIDGLLQGWTEPERSILREELQAIQRELQSDVDPETDGPSRRAEGKCPETTGLYPGVTAIETDRTESSQQAFLGRFGNYELLEVIARGGMGVVFKACQVVPRRIVAIKMILSGQFASRLEVQRFEAEAEAAANLDHPAIVPIYEVGEHDGQRFYSMGYVDGPSLSSRLADGPLPQREAADLLVQVAEAVEYAHAQGVIHRDLKPANILVNQQGQARITDFGLAKRIHTDSDLTTTGQVLGTPSYMSPEQAGGRTGEVGPRSDVYSLGAVLYALLTGRPPFHAPSLADTLRQVLEEEPLLPRQLNPEISRDLETICLKCLEKQQARRYESARALAEELRRWLNGEPILARPASTTERLVKWARRRPAVAGLMVATLVALIAAGIALSGAMYNAGLRRSLAETEAAKDREAIARGEAEQARDQEAIARRAAEDANKRALRADYLRRIALARAEWQDENTRAVVRLLNGCPKEQRGWEWFYLSRLCHQDLMTLMTLATNGGINCIAVSPDGQRIFAGGGDGQGNGCVVVFDATSGGLIRTLRGFTGAVRAAVVSHNGEWLATGTGRLNPSVA